jgi:DNA polymerase III delta prime subunit
MGSFTKAERKKWFIKLAIAGISGSGKTYSALRLARGLVGDKGRIAFIDTENGSATLYDTLTDFDHCVIQPNANGKFHYQDFIDKIQEAERLGDDAVIVDSASHLWQGILADKEILDMNSKSGNTYTTWAQPTKNFNATIQKFLQSRIHLISCMRSKTDYVMELNDKGKQAPRKVGLAPVMRDGIEYEFTVVFDVLAHHESATSKDRTGLQAAKGNCPRRLRRNRLHRRLHRQPLPLLRPPPPFPLLLRRCHRLCRNKTTVMPSESTSNNSWMKALLPFTKYRQSPSGTPCPK